jgi:phospho-N-acetylmuramoyl-pentapeptide-transferase
MISLLTAGALALLVAGGLTPLLIGQLRRRGIGQQIREDGPSRHQAKAGTPTMGGLAMVAAVAVGYLVAHFHTGAPFTPAGWVVMMAFVGTGLVGALDDWAKIRNSRNLGLSKRAKISGQLAVALAAAFMADRFAHVQPVITLAPPSLLRVQMPEWLWIVFAVLVIVGSSNAVNLTDGLDGLAAGSSAFSFGCLAIIGYWEFRHSYIYHVAPALDLAITAVALTGACAGFLWWNASPARIFMGDTGSLALGAALGAICLELDAALLLIVIGGLFVIETISVIVQVAGFRLFGFRVFKMAPLHHHFELLGWPETTVIVRFWILAGLMTAVGLGLFYAQFLSLGVIGS